MGPTGSAPHAIEEWRYHPGAALKWRRRQTDTGDRRFDFSYYMGSDRLDSLNSQVDMGDPSIHDPELADYHYDDAGNARFTEREVYVDDGGGWTEVFFEATAGFYGADDRLMAFQRYGDKNDADNAGAFEEYWYDALGRRVLVRSRADDNTLCDSSQCVSAIRRFVWDGDQILWEISGPGETSVSPTGLENHLSTSEDYGKVAYIHGGTLDQPLGLIRLGYVNGATVRMTLHPDYRGTYVWGSKPDGDLVSNCNTTVQSYCDSTIEIRWPGTVNLGYHEDEGGARPKADWFGSLVTGKRDLSGQIYMRNRYYDPYSGRFTQEDPIGIAGGLNIYGFADGDPVTYSDPFGLAPSCEPLCGMMKRYVDRKLGAALRGAVDLAHNTIGRFMGKGEITTGPATLGMETGSITNPDVDVPFSLGARVGLEATGGIGLRLWDAPPGSVEGSFGIGPQRLGLEIGLARGEGVTRPTEIWFTFGGGWTWKNPINAVSVSVPMAELTEREENF